MAADRLPIAKYNRRTPQHHYNYPTIPSMLQRSNIPKTAVGLQHAITLTRERGYVLIYDLLPRWIFPLPAAKTGCAFRSRANAGEVFSNTRLRLTSRVITDGSLYERPCLPATSWRTVTENGPSTNGENLSRSVQKAVRLRSVWKYEISVVLRIRGHLRSHITVISACCHLMRFAYERAV